MFRSEPIVWTPPLANNAFGIVDETADGVRAGPHDFAEHEYLNRPQLAERDVRTHADHLLSYAVFDQGRASLRTSGR